MEEKCIPDQVKSGGHLNERRMATKFSRENIRSVIKATSFQI